MHLTTERLRLSKLQPEDWQLFQAVHNDRAIMRWIGAIPTVSDVHQRFNERLAPWQTTSYHMLCLVIRLQASGEAVGMLGANPSWLPHRQVEVGYSLLTAHWGHGYASEALAALCQFLSNECEFHKLTASVVEGNWASRRVLEKNGFLLEGTLRDNYLLREQWVNDWVFGRLNNVS
ncbi:RimJ/RimL family protein N-acetyltransferase [Erwinia toletana]|uniref:RimJ/RimL family protein N-acetyltransferase n=1 Tax=Winslowiella toletana TaxID=92490 RepID=A0ABS4P6F8_9GAMM|nr:GNAT family N-acetyltransferase [Winslowiella toletana]MBP2167752.1 RimJ/RimL family protein N-acetyltransferase [Winslowiella toletana]